MHLTIDKYQELGYAYVKDFFSPEEVEYYKGLMLKMRENGNLRQENDQRYYNKSEGGSSPEFVKVLREKTPQIKELFKLNKIVPESVYARFYYNDCTLHPHSDRPGLDHTLSVTLFSNLDEPWPLYCLDKNCDQESFDIKPGDGAMVPGTRIVHWRRRLKCRSDQFVIQVFFHWKNT